MTGIIRGTVLALLLLGVAGCAQGPRTIQEVIQYSDDLTLDTTQVPEEWLERSVWKKQIGETRTVRVKSPHRVKVILVPEETPTTVPAAK
jgi:hypothetical protein